MAARPNYKLIAEHFGNRGPRMPIRATVVSVPRASVAEILRSKGKAMEGPIRLNDELHVVLSPKDRVRKGDGESMGAEIHLRGGKVLTALVTDAEFKEPHWVIKTPRGDLRLLRVVSGDSYRV